MDKYRPQSPDEEAPGLEGPDYVALVIEWDDLDDALDDALGEALEAAELGMEGAPPAEMSTAEEDQGWNRVDEASLESFPASDPPAWGSSHAVAEVFVQEEDVPEAISEQVTSPFRSEGRFRGVRRLMLGLAAIVALFSMIEGLRRLRHA